MRFVSILFALLATAVSIPVFAQKKAKSATQSAPASTSTQASGPVSGPASLETKTTTAPGPRFIQTDGHLYFPRWSAGLSFQNITGSKGLSLEAMTPSFLYGRGAVRVNYSRNFIQTYSKDTLAANPASGVEYLGFNILALNLIVPMGTPVDGLSPYVGGGINFVLPEKALSGNSSQLNFGVLVGFNMRMHHPTHGVTPWSLFGEYGYNSENVEAEKSVGNPQIADGMIVRGGARYFF